jgi:adenylosuccinate lyase
MAVHGPVSASGLSIQRSNTSCSPAGSSVEGRVAPKVLLPGELNEATMVNPLDAISPVDGRYADRTKSLRRFASETALARERVHVEVQYLLTLDDVAEVPLTLSAEERTAIREVYEQFDRSDADRIKQIETDGTQEHPPTHHDVKAVEYFLRDQVRAEVEPWIHFGLTSEDVNNLARRLLIRGALEDVLIPSLQGVEGELENLARAGRGTAMPARTHGQPASPTTFGKECAVFATRIGRTLASVQTATDALQGKCSGATGTYAAHVVALPDVDWRTVCSGFVADLGLDPVEPTTQVNPGDDLARVFDALGRVAGVCLDCTRDFWTYTADGYLRQTVGEDVGSSTMPHKVNPIDFENAEGNLEKARSDLDFLSSYLVTSRLQRDLSDSTVKRTVGPTLAHLLLAADRLADGLADVAPDAAAMRADLETHPEVLTEAIQSCLRVAGHRDAYERVKAETRGQQVTVDSLAEIVQKADLPEDIADRLLALRPETYVGLAAELADVPPNE